MEKLGLAECVKCSPVRKLLAISKSLCCTVGVTSVRDPLIATC